MPTYYYAFQNVTNPVEFLQYINFLTGHYFGPAMVAVLFCILFISMKRYESEKAFAAAIFPTTLVCFLLMLIDLTSMHHVLLTSIGAVVAVIILRTSKGRP